MKILFFSLIRGCFTGQALAIESLPINPDVRQDTIGQTICATGWARIIRPYVGTMKAIKAEMLAAIGAPLISKESI